MKIMKKSAILLVLLLTVCLANFCFAQNIEKRLRGKRKILYKVYFNAVPVGEIEWKYLGREAIGDREADVLFLDSDTDIISLLSLNSKEKVFIDTLTQLPCKVERDVIFSGKKEFIEEIYDQDKGCVKIRKFNSHSEAEEETLCTDKPVHNILELLYFFPEDIELKKGKVMNFNLPTQKVQIKFITERVLKQGDSKEETYFLKGSGDKKFNLWLDKEKKLPLRLEFILLVGKLTIVRQDNL
ncbi:MAG: hypothetical protein ABIH08_04035 [Candidatus Omnitrophota bacterium]